MHPDQGSQFSCIDWVAFQNEYYLEHSMDTKEIAMTTQSLKASLIYFNVYTLSAGSIKQETKCAWTYSPHRNIPQFKT